MADPLFIKNLETKFRLPYRMPLSTTSSRQDLFGESVDALDNFVAIGAPKKVSNSVSNYVALYYYDGTIKNKFSAKFPAPPIAVLSPTFSSFTDVYTTYSSVVDTEGGTLINSSDSLFVALDPTADANLNKIKIAANQSSHYGDTLKMIADPNNSDKLFLLITAPQTVWSTDTNKAIGAAFIYVIHKDRYLAAASLSPPSTVTPFVTFEGVILGNRVAGTGFIQTPIAADNFASLSADGTLQDISTNGDEPGFGRSLSMSVVTDGETLTGQNGDKDVKVVIGSSTERVWARTSNGAVYIFFLSKILEYFALAKLDLVRFEDADLTSLTNFNLNDAFGTGQRTHNSITSVSATVGYGNSGIGVLYYKIVVPEGYSGNNTNGINDGSRSSNIYFGDNNSLNPEGTILAVTTNNKSTNQANYEPYFLRMLAWPNDSIFPTLYNSDLVTVNNFLGAELHLYDRRPAGGGFNGGGGHGRNRVDKVYLIDVRLQTLRNEAIFPLVDGTVSQSVFSGLTAPVLQSLSAIALNTTTGKGAASTDKTRRDLAWFYFPSFLVSKIDGAASSIVDEPTGEDFGGALLSELYQDNGSITVTPTNGDGSLARRVRVVHFGDKNSALQDQDPRLSVGLLDKVLIVCDPRFLTWDLGTQLVETGQDQSVGCPDVSLNYLTKTSSTQVAGPNIASREGRTVVFAFDQNMSSFDPAARYDITDVSGSVSNPQIEDDIPFNLLQIAEFRLARDVRSFELDTVLPSEDGQVNNRGVSVPKTRAFFGTHCAAKIIDNPDDTLLGGAVDRLLVSAAGKHRVYVYDIPDAQDFTDAPLVSHSGYVIQFARKGQELLYDQLYDNITTVNNATPVWKFSIRYAADADGPPPQQDGILAKEAALASQISNLVFGHQFALHRLSATNTDDGALIVGASNSNLGDLTGGTVARAGNAYLEQNVCLDTMICEIEMTITTIDQNSDPVDTLLITIIVYDDAGNSTVLVENNIDQVGGSFSYVSGTVQYTFTFVAPDDWILPLCHKVIITDPDSVQCFVNCENSDDFIINNFSNLHTAESRCLDCEPAMLCLQLVPCAGEQKGQLLAVCPEINGQIPDPWTISLFGSFEGGDLTAFTIVLSVSSINISSFSPAAGLSVASSNTIIGDILPGTDNAASMVVTLNTAITGPASNVELGTLVLDTSNSSLGHYTISILQNDSNFVAPDNVGRISSMTIGGIGVTGPELTLTPATCDLECPLTVTMTITNLVGSQILDRLIQSRALEDNVLELSDFIIDIYLRDAIGNTTPAVLDGVALIGTLDFINGQLIYSHNFVLPQNWVAPVYLRACVTDRAETWYCFSQCDPPAFPTQVDGFIDNQSVPHIAKSDYVLCGEVELCLIAEPCQRIVRFCPQLNITECTTDLQDCYEATITIDWNGGLLEGFTIVFTIDGPDGLTRGLPIKEISLGQDASGVVQQFTTNLFYRKAPGNLVQEQTLLQPINNAGCIQVIPGDMTPVAGANANWSAVRVVFGKRSYMPPGNYCLRILESFKEKTTQATVSSENADIEECPIGCLKFVNCYLQVECISYCPGNECTCGM